MSDALTPRLRMAGPLLTLEQAAALLGVTGSTLRQRIRAGHLQAFRHGRNYFIARKWLEQYRAERHRQPGRPRTTRSLQAEFSRLVADAMGLDLPADFAALDELFFTAARRLVLVFPRTEPRALMEVISGYRILLADREEAGHRQQAVSSIAAHVYEDRLVCEEYYRAAREEARRSPSNLGQRWRALLLAKLGALVVDPRPPYAIVQLDLVIARELAGELQRARPTVSDQELCELLAGAMLEGSECLPEAPDACAALIKATVEDAIAQSDTCLGARDVATR